MHLQDMARLFHGAHLVSVSPWQELIWGLTPALLRNLSTVSVKAPKHEMGFCAEA